MMKEKYYRELPEGYSKIGKTPRKIAKAVMYALAIPYAVILFYPIVILKRWETLSFVIGLIICVCSTPIHEGLHRLGFRVFAGCVETKSVLNKKSEEFHAEAKGFFTKTQTMLTSLLPFSSFSFIGVLFLTLTRGYFRQITIGFLITNFIVCIPDIFDFIWELTRPKETLFEIPGDIIIAYGKNSKNSQS